MPELVNPLVLGVWVDPARPRAGVVDLLSQTGRNTGNLLFASAASAIAGTPERIPPRSFESAQAQGHDCIILSAANWLGPGADFGAVSDQIEAADLPVIVLGLGAQAGLDQKIPALHPGTRRLISMLAERSPMISARGPFSAEVLAHYGAKNVMVTGCPSLLKSRGVQPSFAAARTEGALAPEDVVLHSTRHHYNPAAPFHAWLYREAKRCGYDLLLQ